MVKKENKATLRGVGVEGKNSSLIKNSNKKQTIKLSKSDLTNLIKESIKKVLGESKVRPPYRGIPGTKMINDEEFRCQGVTLDTFEVEQFFKDLYKDDMRTPSRKQKFLQDTGASGEIDDEDSLEAWFQWVGVDYLRANLDEYVFMMKEMLYEGYASPSFRTLDKWNSLDNLEVEPLKTVNDSIIRIINTLHSYRYKYNNNQSYVRYANLIEKKAKDMNGILFMWMDQMKQRETGLQPYSDYQYEHDPYDDGSEDKHFRQWRKRSNINSI